MSFSTWDQGDAISEPVASTAFPSSANVGIPALDAEMPGRPSWFRRRKLLCSRVGKARHNAAISGATRWTRAPRLESMQETLPVLLVPGLLCTPRLYIEQIPALWRFGPVVVADHTRDDSMRSGIAQRILANAPPRFALIGLSMGGDALFELLRQAPERVAKLALLDTTARPDLPEQTEQRKRQIDMARSGRFAADLGPAHPKFVAASRQNDRALQLIVRTMAEEVGPEAFVRQQTVTRNASIRGRTSRSFAARRS